jgi:glycerol-3-phosphate dehydrogenase (NAD(P)+)
MKKIGMLGGGAWGTAVATALAHNGHEVIMWCLEQEVVNDIQATHINNRYLPGIKLSPLIIATANLADVFQQTNIIFQAIPVAHMRSIFQQAKRYVESHHRFVVLSKGLEYDRLMLPSQVITDVLPGSTTIAGVAGPSFAYEFAQKSLTGLSVAGNDTAFKKEVHLLLRSSYCCTYDCDDLIGQQCGGAFKNVLALGLGILEGAGAACNTRALAFTRGLQEIALCSHVLGGKKETLYGLSGIGDLMLTSMGKLSRNAYLGRCLGQGQSIGHVIEELGTAPEGFNTAASVHQLAQRYKLDLPVLDCIYHITRETCGVRDFFQTLGHIDACAFQD